MTVVSVPVVVLVGVLPVLVCVVEVLVEVLLVGVDWGLVDVNPALLTKEPIAGLVFTNGFDWVPNTVTILPLELKFDTAPNPSGDLIALELADTVFEPVAIGLDLLVLDVDLLPDIPAIDNGELACAIVFVPSPMRFALILRVPVAFVLGTFMDASLLVCIALTISALVALV